MARYVCREYALGAPCPWDSDKPCPLHSTYGQIRFPGRVASDIFEPILTDDDLWAQSWLDRTYGGAPDECSMCFREGKFIKIDDCTNPDH